MKQGIEGTALIGDGGSNGFSSGDGGGGSINGAGSGGISTDTIMLGDGGTTFISDSGSQEI